MGKGMRVMMCCVGVEGTFTRSVAASLSPLPFTRPYRIHPHYLHIASLSKYRQLVKKLEGGYESCSSASLTSVKLSAVLDHRKC